MKKLITLLVTLFILVFGIIGVAYAHPGRLDKSGGHVCRSNCQKYGLKNGQYHKHKAKAVKKAKRVSKKKAKKKVVSPAGTCNPNYSGVCVPVASDVDCKGGGGNGPAYVAGPFKVVGQDVYGLDTDSDGLGCENQ